MILKKRVWALTFLLYMGLFLFTGEKTYAANLGFSVQVQQPTAQIDKKTPYLDLRLKPLEESEITAIVKNKSTSQPLSIEINYSSAKTNSDGVIEYAPYDMASDKSLKFDFKDVVQGPSEIELKPDEERDLKFQIQMPKEEFDGYIAGGIELKQKIKSVAKEEEVVATEFSYILGMRLSQNDKEAPVKMEFRKIQTGYNFGKPAIMTFFSNTSSNYVENMEVTVNIKKTDDKKSLLTRTSKELRMAPNSMMMYPIQVDDREIQTGNYVAEINVSTKKGFKKSWTEPFLYKLDREGKYHEEGVIPQKKSTKFVIVLLLITTIVFLIVGFLFYKFIKKNSTHTSKRK